MDRHGGKPAAARAGARYRDARRSCLRARNRRPAVRERDARSLGRGHLYGPADGDPAGPVHRLRIRGTFQGRPDRDRRCAVSHPRSFVGRRRAAGRADRQGPVARRILLAGGDQGRAAAGDATADRRGAPFARAGVSVSHLGRSNRGGERARLPHLPGATLSRHGRDSSVCRVDYVAGLSHGLRACVAVARRAFRGLTSKRRRR